jgi:pyrroloquinoline quinone biosynthesis protein B
MQDGGLPHAACDCRRCERARTEPGAKRYVASLGIVLPEAGQAYLVDATPDVVPQLATLRRALARASGRPAADPGGVDRSPLDGIFLTHAHMGHYLGLAHFGTEAVSTHRLPVWGTPRMLSFLRDNGPWEQLVRLENVDLRELEPGRGRPGTAVELGEGVSVAALAVPHRDEYSDTVGYVVRGPRRAVLYVPDTDGWDDWPVPPERVIERAGIDVALLDGTFHSGDELPGRDLSKVRHPFVAASAERFAPLVARGVEIRFIHFNHTNPAVEAGGAVERELAAQGFGLAREGDELGL